jgi:hypothetical protein
MFKKEVCMKKDDMANKDGQGEWVELTVALVLHGLDVAYADDLQGKRYVLDQDSVGMELGELRGGARIKARADGGGRIQEARWAQRG